MHLFHAKLFLQRGFKLEPLLDVEITLVVFASIFELDPLLVLEIRLVAAISIVKLAPLLELTSKLVAFTTLSETTILPLEAVSSSMVFKVRYTFLAADFQIFFSL